VEQITSKNNEIIKKLQKLKQKKYRDIFNLAIIEGEKNCIEAYNAEAIDSIVFTEKYVNSKLPFFTDKNLKQIFVSSNVFNLLTSETCSQQILAVVKINYKPKNLKPKNNFLICENVQNPGNLGAIFRTALATNFLDIYLIDCVDEFNTKVINASVGNIFKLNINKIDYLDIDTIKNNKNIELCSTLFNGENALKFIPNKQKIYGLILGNEGNGVSQKLIDKSSLKLTIPMQNNVESLNVAVAASLLMYKFQGGNYERS